MKRKFGIYILLGIMLGGIFGLFFGDALENIALGIGLGALGGVFMGWFVAAIGQQQEQTQEDTEL